MLFKMKLNLIGKINYIHEIVFNYSDWPLIFLNRLRNVFTNKIHLRNGIVIEGGAKSLVLDLSSEIFINKIYNPMHMSVNSDDTVVDIGANIGVFSLYAAKHFAKNIYAIEPMFENIYRINNNFEINNLSKPTVINAAVSDKNGFAKLYLGDLDSHGLLFDHNHKQKFTMYQKVKTMTLDKIVFLYKIKRINFLKIDCEGSEGEVIKSIKDKTWKIIDKIAIEYHDGVSTLSHFEIVERLKMNMYNVEIAKTGELFGYIYAWR